MHNFKFRIIFRLKVIFDYLYVTSRHLPQRLVGTFSTTLAAKMRLRAVSRELRKIRKTRWLMVQALAKSEPPTSAEEAVLLEDLLSGFAFTNSFLKALVAEHREARLALRKIQAKRTP
jgi:hypothetical protein